MEGYWCVSAVFKGMLAFLPLLLFFVVFLEYYPYPSCAVAVAWPCLTFIFALFWSMGTGESCAHSAEHTLLLGAGRGD